MKLSPCPKCWGRGILEFGKDNKELSPGYHYKQRTEKCPFCEGAGMVLYKPVFTLEDLKGDSDGKDKKL